MRIVEVKIMEKYMYLGGFANEILPSMITYNIGFENPETKRDDETQYSAVSLSELECLWLEFCAENNIHPSSVIYVQHTEDEVL